MLVALTLLRLSAAVLFGFVVRQLAEMKNRNGRAWGVAASALMLMMI
jgi:hypothetical protein